MSSGEKLFTLLRTALKNMHRILEKELVELGISHAEARLLVLIDEENGCSQENLTSQVEVDRSNVGRALKKLENLGHIKRLKSVTDKRAYQIYLTSSGVLVKTKVVQIKQNFEKVFIKDVSEDEVKTLIKLLEKLEGRINDSNYYSSLK